MSIYETANQEIPTKSLHDSMAIKDQRKTIFDSTKKYKDQQNIEEILNNHASDPVHVNNVFFMNTE
jgi:hypothetical protein